MAKIARYNPIIGPLPGSFRDSDQTEHAVEVEAESLRRSCGACSRGIPAGRNPNGRAGLNDRVLRHSDLQAH